MADLAMRASNDALLSRLLSKSVPGWGGCLIWTGTRTNGYGIIGVDGKTRGAHRVMYEHVVGAIQPGMHIDHQCRVRCCINPYHLESVTPKENQRRTRGYRGGNQCHDGHQMHDTTARLRPSGSFPGSAGSRRECIVCWAELSVRRLFAASRPNAKLAFAVQLGQHVGTLPLEIKLIGSAHDRRLRVKVGRASVTLNSREAAEHLRTRLDGFSRAVAAFGEQLPTDSDPDMDEALRRVRATQSGGAR